MRTETNLAQGGYIADPSSVDRESGRQIDWTQVTEAYRASKVEIEVATNASADDEEIEVIATPVDLPVGTSLYFGGSKKFARLTAFAAAGSTTLTVEALPTALVDGDKAVVGGAGEKLVKAGTVMAEVVSTGKIIPRAIIPSERATVAQAFSGTGNGVLTLADPASAQDVKAGAYKVVFTEPATDLGRFQVFDPDGNLDGTGIVGTAYTGSVKFTIADGSTDFVVGDTFTLTVTLTYKTVGLLETNANEESKTDSKSGYGLIVGGVFYENLLPDATGSPSVLPAAYKSELQAAGIGTGYAFRQFGDNT